MAARGGRRQGTPGKAYANRTDLAMNMGPQTGTTTAAAGGLPAPAHTVSAPETPRMGLSPDQTPNLFDPGSGAPITAGLPTGAGPGPSAPPVASEAAIIAQYLPDLAAHAQRPGAPDSFKALVRYLQGQ